MNIDSRNPGRRSGQPARRRTHGDRPSRSGIIVAAPLPLYSRPRSEWRCRASWLAEAGSDEFNRIATVAMMDARSAPASRVDAEPPSTEARRVPAAVSTRRGTTFVTRTLGEAWLDVAGLILAHGAESSFGGLPLLEVDLVTLDIASPDANDALIAAHASPEWLAWMRGNFTDHSRVAELG